MLQFIKKNQWALLFLGLIAAFFFMTGFTFRNNHEKENTGNKIIGTWLSAKKDLKVEIYQKNEAYFGRIVWFACEPKTPDMHAFKDTQNPDPKLRERKWLGMNVLQDLTYNDKGYWSDGKIYDPNSGTTYSSTVHLTSDNTVSVKGYWGIELIGKSLEFHRVN